MLKIALIILVIFAIIMILGLFIYSVKLLRKAEQEQRLEKNQTKPSAQLHPKFKQQQSNKDKTSK